MKQLILAILLSAIAIPALAQPPVFRPSGATYVPVNQNNPLVLGGGATTQSGLRFREPNGSGSNYTEIKAQTQAANLTYTLPAAYPSVSGQALVATDAGVMSWSSVTTDPAGADTQIQFNDSGAFGASSNLTWDGSGLRLNNSTDNNVLTVESSNATSSSMVHFKNLTVQGPFIDFHSSPRRWGFGITSAGHFVFRDSAVGTDPVNGTTLFTVTNSTGLVGVNESSPGAQLHTVASSATTVGSIVEGAAAQTADIAQWNPSGVTAGERARITSAGEFSNTMGEHSEVFGAGATVVGNNSVVVGRNATAYSKSVVIGDNSSSFPGPGASEQNVVIGSSSNVGNAGNNSMIAIGYFVSVTGTKSIAIGANSASAYSDSVVLGNSAASTATNQFIVGGTSSPINDIYFGKGVTNATPTAYTIHGTGGSGTDIVGAALNIAGGQGTGSGAGGSLNLQTAAAGSTGSSLNSLTTRLLIDSTGLVEFATDHADTSSDDPTTDAPADWLTIKHNGTEYVVPLYTVAP